MPNKECHKDLAAKQCWNKWGADFEQSPDVANISREVPYVASKPAMSSAELWISTRVFIKKKSIPIQGMCEEFFLFFQSGMCEELIVRFKGKNSRRIKRPSPFIRLRWQMNEIKMVFNSEYSLSFGLRKKWIPWKQKQNLEVYKNCG